MTDQASEYPPEQKSLFQLTRELELLISAGLVLALLQLPVLLDDWWMRTSVHVGGGPYLTVFVIYYAGKLISYGLIVAIATHFLLRGFWVAIMGLRSVFPHGIRTEKLEQGQIYQKFYGERLMSLDAIESRVDRVAASIFAFVFLFLLTFVMLAVWGGGAWLIAFVIAKITGKDVIAPVMTVLFGLYVVLQMSVAWVDRISKRRPVSERTERIALRMLKWIYYLTFNFAYAPVFFTFASNTSKRRMTVLLVSFVYAMIGFFMLSVFASQGIVGFDSYAYYPAQAREHQLRAIHYDNLRPADMLAKEPSIQSEIVEGPYLRLFVPYDAQEDNERMRALCPEVEPLRGDGPFVARRGKLPAARVAELTGCFDRLHQIDLDGKRLEKPGFVFYRHPSGRVAGRLALVPLDAVARGRHLLTVRHTPLPGVKKDEKADEYFIPFWR